jgi:hypothetical protein
MNVKEEGTGGGDDISYFSRAKFKAPADILGVNAGWISSADAFRDGQGFGTRDTENKRGSADVRVLGVRLRLFVRPSRFMFGC